MVLHINTTIDAKPRRVYNESIKLYGQQRRIAKKEKKKKNLPTNREEFYAFFCTGIGLF
jgi:hypothetical protein